MRRLHQGEAGTAALDRRRPGAETLKELDLLETHPLQTLLLPQAKAQTEDELIDELLQTSYEHSAVLTTRLTQVKVAKSFIFKGKLKDALDHIAGLQGPPPLTSLP